jgi:hypothetical protein
LLGLNHSARDTFFTGKVKLAVSSIAFICNEDTVPHKALPPERTVSKRLIRTSNASASGAT